MQIRRFNPAKYLNSEEDMQAYLQIHFEEDGIKGFQHALGVVARAKDDRFANETGLMERRPLISLNHAYSVL